MIKGLMGSNGIAVNGGNTSLPFVNANINNPMTGMIRIHGTKRKMSESRKKLWEQKRNEK